MRRLVISTIVVLIAFNVACEAVWAASARVNISADTYVEQGYPGVSPWNNKNVYVGYDVYYGKMRTRAFFAAPVEELLEDEILARDIISAYLNTYQYGYEGSGSYLVDVYAVRQGWDEKTLNWNNQPSNIAHISREVFAAHHSWKKVSITRFVTDVLSGSANNGITMRMVDETHGAGIFWSIACLNAPTPPSCLPGEQPYISVYYKPNTPPPKPELLIPEDDYLTSDPVVNFLSETVVDPDGEKIVYQLALVPLTYSSPWQDQPEFSYTFQQDGEYEWRVKAMDEHGPKTGMSVSDSRKITIDSTAPVPPEIIPEPPYTSGNSNLIEWEKTTDNLSPEIWYSAEVSEFEDFREIKELSQWQKETSFEFQNLADGQKYFYRVRAKDWIDNVSDYSAVTASTQDANPPEINGFKASHSRISPFNPTSMGKFDWTRVTGEITDTTLQSWSLIFTNSSHALISKFAGTSSKILQNWPKDDSKINSLKDGYYFAYVEAVDQFGKERHSDSLRIYVDDTSPATPKFILPTNGWLTNSRSFTSNISVERGTRNEILLNESLLGDFPATGTTLAVKLNKIPEGTNKLSVISRDSVENKSSAEVNFQTDYTPPSAPKIRLTPDTINKRLYLEITGEPGSTAKIYVNGRLARNHKMQSDYQMVLLTGRWEENYFYSVFVKLVDRAGNVSQPSKTESYRTPIDPGIGSALGKKQKFPAVPKKSECWVKVHIDKKSFIMNQCNIPAPALASVDNLGKGSNGNHWFVSYGSVQQEIILDVEYFACKPKTIWDPRTWFTCVTYKAGDEAFFIKMNTTVAPIVSKLGKTITVALQKIDNKSHFESKMYAAADPAGKNHSMRTAQWVSMKISGVRVPISRLSPPSNSIKIPPAPQPKRSGRYFSFMFRKLIGVTQWHGYTAFQSPHMGIDFGSVKEVVISPADGWIRAVGWDSYYGRCYSGGNFVRIEHDNGMHTVYFHLENYKRSDGRNWRTGERIKRGQRVGLSGNTGAWGCKGFGYHLHFELRKNSYQSSHVDPVPYIDVDWNRIPTLGWQQNRGRLSGDNPHPDF